MKTKEELAAIKAELEDVRMKLSALTGEELEQVTGGIEPDVNDGAGGHVFEAPVLIDTWFYFKSPSV